MAERSTLTELVQIGCESVEGTGVACTKRVSGTAVTAKSGAQSKNTRASGHRADAFSSLIYESSTLDLSGEANYTEVVYWLSSAFKAATAVAGGATSYVWTFNPSSTALETVKSYTLEVGQTARGNRVVGVKIDSLGWTFDKEAGVSFKGSGIGHAVEDPFTLTTLAATDEIGHMPILSSQVDVYLDTTWAALGGTKLLRCQTASIDFGDIWRPLKALNSTISGQVATVGGPETNTGNLLMQADANGGTQLAKFRSGLPMFLRIKAVGPQIDAAPLHSYTFQIDCAINYTGWDFSQSDTVDFGMPFTLVTDPVSGKWLEITVENKLSAL